MTTPATNLAAWARPVPYTRREMVSLVVLWPVLVLLVPMMVRLAAQIDPLATLFAGVTITLAATLPLVMAGHRRRVSPRRGIRTYTSANATVIRQPYFRLLLVSTVCGGLVFGVAGAVVILAAYPFGHSAQALALATVAVLAVASFSAELLAGRLHPKSISLSSKGIVQRGYTWETFLAWEHIESVTPQFFTDRKLVQNMRQQLIEVDTQVPAVAVQTAPTAAPIRRRPKVWLWRVEQIPTGLFSTLRIDCRDYVTNPLTMLGLIDFYARNPQARNELGTDAALMRGRAIADPTVIT